VIAAKAGDQDRPTPAGVGRIRGNGDAIRQLIRLKGHSGRYHSCATSASAGT